MDEYKKRLLLEYDSEEYILNTFRKILWNFKMPEKVG